MFLEKDNPLVAYLKGDRKTPLVSKGTCHRACEALFPSRISQIGFVLRCLLGGAINFIPFSALKIQLWRWAGAEIGRDVYVAPTSFLDPFCPSLIKIGDGVVIGLGARLLTHEYTTEGFRVGQVIVEDGAVVGAWATVRSGVVVGRRAIVGMNSFVNKDVPEGATVGGVPARLIKAPFVSTKSIPS